MRLAAKRRAGDGRPPTHSNAAAFWSIPPDSARATTALNGNRQETAPRMARVGAVMGRESRSLCPARRVVVANFRVVRAGLDNQLPLHRENIGLRCSLRLPQDLLSHRHVEPLVGVIGFD